MIFNKVSLYHHHPCDASDECVIAVSIVSFANHLAKMKNFSFGGEMGGMVLRETDAFRILERINPGIRGIDFVDFIESLSQAHEEIVELERVINA
jgi:hypothetical protein